MAVGVAGTLKKIDMQLWYAGTVNVWARCCEGNTAYPPENAVYQFGRIDNNESGYSGIGNLCDGPRSSARSS